MDEALTPAPLSDKVLEHHKIFQVPIIVIPGLNHNAVRMQLETLLMQPGIKTEMVTVGQSDSKIVSCLHMHILKRINLFFSLMCLSSTLREC